jgi:hypothetical protein
MTAEEIVDKLLENEQPELPFEPHPEDVAAEREAELDDFVSDYVKQNAATVGDRWEHIDGDTYVWTYGGTYYNPAHRMLVHMDGLDGNVKEFWANEMELTPEEQAALLAKFPVQVDPEYPEGGDENELERERAEDDLKENKAEAANAARKQRVYRSSVDEFHDRDWNLNQVLDGIENGAEVLAGMNDAQKWCLIGQTFGWEELDSYPDLYTKAELEEYLGMTIH